MLCYLQQAFERVPVISASTRLHASNLMLHYSMALCRPRFALAQSQRLVGHQFSSQSEYRSSNGKPVSSVSSQLTQALSDLPRTR